MYYSKFDTSALKKKVGMDADDHCRLCKNQVEDMFHVISSCSRMSSRYSLPLIHNDLPRYVYEQLCTKLVPGCKTEYPSDKFISFEGNIECWWNLLKKQLLTPKIINLT